MNETPVLYARKAAPVRSAPERVEERRVCLNLTCDTVLSAYNKNDQCYLHQPRKKIRIRGRTPSEVMDKEVAVPHNCSSCMTLTGSEIFEELSKVLLDGIVHAQGTNGKGTICEA